MIKLLAYQISGETVFIDKNSWTQEELNGNKSILFSEDLLDGYKDITSIDNIDKYGYYVNVDYIYLKDRIRDVSDSKGGWTGTTVEEKYILIKYYNYRDLNMEKVMFLMSQGYSQQQAMIFLVKSWFKHNLQFIPSIIERWKFSKFYLLTMCDKNSVEEELERLEIAHSLHLMKEYGIVGSGYGDVNRKGIMDYFESTGLYVDNGFLESGIQTFDGLTKEMVISQVQDVMINGNYDPSMCNQ